MNRHLLLAAATTCALALGARAQNIPDGYYKDIFMDSGIMLTSRTTLPSADALGLSMEAFVSTRHSYTQKYRFTPTDTIRQRELIAGCPMDENGILLYPDGQPRFRMVYMNGGRAANHANSLGEEGKQAYRDFVGAGGSYVGSCAGAYIACKGTIKSDGTTGREHQYMGLWPGYARSTGLEKSWTAVDIVKKSPLMALYSIEGRPHIDSVRHNGGCYADMQTAPKGTEVLALYSTKGRELTKDIDSQPCIWAYKASASSGRVVLCGSHPEGASEHDNLALMNAMVRYALDGNGKRVLKGTLAPGDTLKMKARSGENDPSHACIGDRQYHYFKIEVPKGADTLTISLDEYLDRGDYDLYLFAGREAFADGGNCSWCSVAPGVSKTLEIPQPEAGTWYISVFCATTVESRQGRYGVEYYGRTDVLNGVPYKISAALTLNR